MTGTDCILCKVLSILHLSWKTETENTILLSGFYEITAWKIHFWGHMCISVSMCEREREKSNYSGTLERQTIGFIRLSKVSYCENSFIKALTCLASSFALWKLQALNCPQCAQISFIMSQAPHSKTSAVLKSQPSPTTYCMCNLCKALAICISVSSYVSWANQITCCVGLLQNKAIITWECLEQFVNIKVGAFILSSRSQKNESWTAHGQRSCKSKPQATLWVS